VRRPPKSQNRHCRPVSGFFAAQVAPALFQRSRARRLACWALTEPAGAHPRRMAATCATASSAWPSMTSLVSPVGRRHPVGAGGQIRRGHLVAAAHVQGRAGNAPLGARPPAPSRRSGCRARDRRGRRPRFTRTRAVGKEPGSLRWRQSARACQAAQHRRAAPSRPVRAGQRAGARNNPRVIILAHLRRMREQDKTSGVHVCAAHVFHTRPASPLNSMLQKLPP